MGMLGWQEYCVCKPPAVWYRADRDVASLSAWLGPLGLNGLTAYIGLLDLGQPKEGETVVVSTAAGAVGSIVGQIARLKGCRAVGITGSDEKVAFCRTEFEYDEAINYKTADLDAALARDCPNGVDVYFDNTSGPISDAVLRRLANGARVVICGTAAVHNWDPPPPGPRVERQLLVRGARMQGFVVLFYRDRFPAALHDLSRWLREGKLHYREDIVDGLENAPAALVGLYEGRNRGKMLIRVGDEP
jgi:NADPH-dependent curcumin reductase CurA